MKPYTVCHLLCSLNGKISGPFFENPATEPASRVYARIRQDLHCQAALYGLTTMAEGFADGLDSGISGPAAGAFEDHVACPEAESCIVSLDAAGSLYFASGTLEKKGRKPAHVIQVLTGQAGTRYLERLKKHGVSFLYAGQDTIDLDLVLHKLSTLWHIDRVLIAGGGITDWSFAREGLLDELSLVLAPAADGNTDTASVFADPVPSDLSCAFQLQKVQSFEDSVVWLDYRTKEQER